MVVSGIPQVPKEKFDKLLGQETAVAEKLRVDPTFRRPWKCEEFWLMLGWGTLTGHRNSGLHWLHGTRAQV